MEFNNWPLSNHKITTNLKFFNNTSNKFIKIINQKRFILISVFLFFYITLNLLDGERGLISYYDKQKKREQLAEKKKSLIVQLALVDKKNSLLTNIIDLDYLEILYRQKFVVGKSHEQIYKID